MRKEIHKKVLSVYFEQILNGSKTFELRLADWKINEGDILVLDEINPRNKNPTDRSIRKKVGYILKTKDLKLFSEDDVNRYGYQVISLLDEDTL